jgi:geranylgeranyl diphosphate synthase type II
MMVEANKFMMKVEDAILRRVMDVFNETATGVCEGQQIDMSFEQRNNVLIDEYLDMIRLKTAVLLGGTLKIGAIIGGATLNDAQLLYSFGVNLGIAFQLQDDILDVYGDPEKFGKQVGGDILSNKKTYLLIKALELAKGNQATELEKWLTLEEFTAADKVAAVTAIYDGLDIRNYAEDAMQTYAEMAFNALDQINLSEDRRQYLRQFADNLLVREY